MRTLIFWLGLIAFPLSLKGQEVKIGHYIGLEMGFHEFFGETIIPDQVMSPQSIKTKENATYYGIYDYTIDKAIHKKYVGIKYEALFMKNRLGVSSGLRFYQMSGLLEHDKYHSSFMWLLHQDEQSADYVAIRSINQKSHYVCVPLEIRFFPKKRDRLFKNYFKIGGSFNYRYSTNYKIDFQESQMSKYAVEVGNTIQKPCTFSGFVFPAVGFKWGRNNYPWFNLEFQFPGLLIAQRKHAFVEPDVGFGMQFAVLIPLNRTIIP